MKVIVPDGLSNSYSNFVEFSNTNLYDEFFSVVSGHAYSPDVKGLNLDKSIFTRILSKHTIYSHLLKIYILDTG